MKISKHTHSCLLVEDNGKVALVDPGEYTAQAGTLDVSKMEKLDYIVITHEHQDHMYIPLIKEVMEKFPNAQIMSNSSVKTKLGEVGLSVITESNRDIILEETAHEEVFDVPSMVANVLVRIFGKLTHPGDSLQLNSTTDVLAIPLQGPWGHVTQAMEKVIQLKPKIVVPIHDWHWREEARSNILQRIPRYLEQHGIQFYSLEDGEVVEI